MATASSSAPVLSTPDDHILSMRPTESSTDTNNLSKVELAGRYEIVRTAKELAAGLWTCIALQFPDSMLKDAPRVVESLQQELSRYPVAPKKKEEENILSEQISLETSMNAVSLDETTSVTETRRLYILGDTSYGACCVDEIAAEHISAEVVVHYGRACLSPTARLPVIYVFTQQPLDYDAVVQAFTENYPDRDTAVVLMADVMYSNHINPLYQRLLSQANYTNIIAPELVHDPSSHIPNRKLPLNLHQEPDSLKKYSLFHISSPPTALLLTLSSRVGEITIFPTTSTTDSTSPSTLKASTIGLLRRRYGLLTSLTTTPIFGILINTLSVSRYGSAAANIASQIRAAGKKSYTFVVGKINAAKIANFAEVGGWIVVGCWESSIVEDDEFWKPVITPFELEMVLKGDKGRVWTGEWKGGFDKWIEDQTSADAKATDYAEEDSEDESAPPEFDLRTGRYVSHSRPIGDTSRRKKQLANGDAATSLVKRNTGDIAIIGNEISPGAQFLRTQRTWRGLGSEITIEYDEDGNEPDTLISEGRNGIARGYANEQHTR